MSTPPPPPTDEYTALIAAYALGEADAATTRAAEALIATDPAARTLFEQYRPVARALPFAAPSAEPAPDLRERLLARVQAEVSGAPVPTAQRAMPRRRLPRWQWAALALNLAAILGLAGWNISLQQQQQAEAARFQRSWNTMVGAMSAPGVQQFQLTAPANTSAAFLFAPQEKLGCLVARGLPQLPANQIYQVWLDKQGSTTSAGTFRVNPQGNGWLVVNNATPISDFDAVRVTVEPASGSTAPNGEQVIRGII